MCTCYNQLQAISQQSTSWPWANFELLSQELEVACFRPCSKRDDHECTNLPYIYMSHAAVLEVRMF